MRRRAKAINFGIIYGISAFGLANQLGIAREEAGDYIKKYFERFPGIRDYMDETQATSAASNGYVETLFGRKMPLSRDQVVEPLGARLQRARRDQRPIQGTAADIIRRAMMRMEEALAAEEAVGAACCCRCTTNWSSRCPTRRSRRRSRWSQHVMEDAPIPAVPLSVPLQVDARAGAELGRGALMSRTGASVVTAKRQ